jgi:3,4-dihydroxy 2-butanone 4-phosphate synthase/GTP cyclohydrolase II
MLQVEEYGSRWSLDEAMKKINKSGSGLIILIDGGKDKEEEIQDLKKSYKQSIPGGIDVRRIGAGSQILRDLGVEKITLMGSKTRYPSISGFGLEVVKYIQK